MALDDLWGHVFDRSEDAVTFVVLVYGDFGKAKVGEEEMTIGVEEAIFGFQVAVDDTKVSMKMLQREDHFGHVERRDFFGEHALLCEVCK